MIVQILWIPYLEDGQIAHLGTGYSKEECLRLIGDGVEGHGVYEYVVEDNKITHFASSPDSEAVRRTLDRIFD